MNKTRIRFLNDSGTIKEIEENCKNVRLSVYLPDYLKHLVALEAHRLSTEDERVSMSSVVIEALKRYFREEQ